MKRTATRSLAAATLALALVPSLTGCFSGPAATTNMQATMNSGNGVQAAVGDVKIENATLVRGPEGSQSATLVMVLSNRGGADDQLVSVKIGGKDATIAPGAPVTIPGGGNAVSFGYNSDKFVNAAGFEAPQSSYVPVELTLQNAGTAQLSVLTVPPVGYYEGIAPSPAA